MPNLPAWADALIVAAIVLPLTGWLGAVFGRKAAKRYPGVAGALWLLSTFLKIDPPPPPKAERVTRDEENAGDPPKV